MPNPYFTRDSLLRERAAEVARRESWASGHKNGKVAKAASEKGKKTDELEKKRG